MAVYLRVKNWDRYQHYAISKAGQKRRRLIWVKLYLDELNDEAFLDLPYATQLLFHRLLLLEARSVNDSRRGIRADREGDLERIVNDTRMRSATNGKADIEVVREGLAQLRKGGWIKETPTDRPASKPASKMPSKSASESASTRARPRGAPEEEVEERASLSLSSTDDVTGTTPAATSPSHPATTPPEHNPRKTNHDTLPKTERQARRNEERLVTGKVPYHKDRAETYIRTTLWQDPHPADTLQDTYTDIPDTDLLELTALARAVYAERTGMEWEH